MYDWVFTSPGHLSRVARWLSFATTPQRWLTFARWVAPGLLSSTSWLRRSCAGQNPSRFAGSAVPPGLQLRPRGRPVSPSPAPTFRVVTEPDRLSIFEKTLAGPNSFICHLRQSSLFDLLLTIPGSDVSRHGCVSPVLGQSLGLCVHSGGYHSACSRAAPGLHGDGAHPCGSTLGPVPLVLGPAPAFAGSSSGPTGPS